MKLTGKTCSGNASRFSVRLWQSNHVLACGANFKKPFDLRSTGVVMKMPYLAFRIDEESLQEEVQRKWDEFLDVYSLYLATQSSWVRDEVKLKAYELHLLNPAFNFQI